MKYLIENLKQKTKIAIFGAGQAGIEFYNEISAIREDIDVAFFVDTYKQGEICGKKIVPFSRFIEKYNTFNLQHVVIASMYYDEIVTQLKAISFSDFSTYRGRPGNLEKFHPNSLFPSRSFQSFQYEMVDKLKHRDTIVNQFSLASIIVLVYNNIEYTSRSLESLVHCTHFPYELIIVDNGSDLNTKKWLHEFIHKQKDKSIESISLKPQKEWSRQKKIYSAKNIALEMARGDLLIINDNDLAYEPFWIYYAAYLFDCFPEAGLLGLQRYKGKTHQILNRIQRCGISVFSMNTVEGCNLILPRSVYEKVGTFKEEAQHYDPPFSGYEGCDVEYTYRLKSHNFLCIVPDKDIIHHIQQPRGYNQ